MRICLGCQAAHVKCQPRGDGHPCHRCFKYHFHCRFSSPVALSLPPPPSSLHLPKCTHQYNATTYSSNRVKAAAVAFLLKRPNQIIANSRTLDSVSKKKLKQEKFLTLAPDVIGHLGRLTEADIMRDVIVFDGTLSYPPPPIFPPETVS